MSVDTIACEEFNANKLIFTELDTESNENLLISIPKYQYDETEKPFIFETDWIEMTQYGIPRKGEDYGYYSNDTNRNFIDVPIDPNQWACAIMGNMLKQIDAKVINNNLYMASFAAEKYVSLNKMVKLFEYIPIVRQKKTYDDDELINPVEYKKREWYPFCRFNFLETFPDKLIGTKFNRVLPNGTLVPINVKVMKDLNADLTLGSRVKMIVSAKHFYATKTKVPSKYVRIAGCTFNVIQMDIKPRIKYNISQLFGKYNFLDESEEDEIEPDDVESIVVEI